MDEAREAWRRLFREHPQSGPLSAQNWNRIIGEAGKGDEIDLRVRLAAGVTPAMSVRAMLGLWGENPELLAQLPPQYRHPDDASCYFLIECWRRLNAGV